MPATNWIAPDTPQVMISLGRTVRPERPTCRLASIQPGLPPSGAYRRELAAKQRRQLLKHVQVLTPRPANEHIGRFNVYFSSGFGGFERLHAAPGGLIDVEADDLPACCAATVPARSSPYNAL